MLITELGPWNLKDHMKESLVAVNVLERVRCPECDQRARVGWKRTGTELVSTEFYCVDCGYLATFGGTFSLDTQCPSGVPFSDHVDGMAMMVQANLSDARQGQSAVDKLAKIAYDDMVARLKPLILRQDSLEKAVEELAQRCHAAHHVHSTHIDNWRDCWKPECGRMRRLMEARIEVEGGE